MSVELLPEEARALLGHGLALLPMNGKRPLIKWEDRPAEPPTNAEIKQWWPSASVGVLLGPRFAVLDVDERANTSGLESLHYLERRNMPLPNTWRALTPSGGLHVWFAIPAGVALDPVQVIEGVELRTGRQVVACPPGLGRHWEITPGEAPLAELPQWLLKAATRHRKKRHGPIDIGSEQLLVPIGQRHHALVRFLGLCRSAGFGEKALVAFAHAFMDTSVEVDEQRCPIDRRHAEQTARMIARRYPPHRNRERRR